MPWLTCSDEYCSICGGEVPHTNGYCDACSDRETKKMTINDREIKNKMTINITIEELQKYESDMRSWGEQRALAVEKLVTTAKYDAVGTGYSQKTFCETGIAVWEGSNPIPTLIPKI